MYHRHTPSTTQCLSYKQVDLLDTFQRLWYEHIIWTREFLLSTAFDLENLDAVTKRLLQNPADFAHAFNPLYGTEMAITFQDLLTDHLLTAAEFLNAIKAGKAKEAQSKRQKWYMNADDISNFLSQTNPYWNKNSWQSMLYSHLEMIETDFIYLLSGQYTDSVREYDAMQHEALKMANYMAHGIIKQLRL